MNVIIVCDFALPTGGSQKVAIESARALAEAGVLVDFVHAVSGRDKQLDHPLITATSLDLPDVWDRPLPQAAVAAVWNTQPNNILAALFAARRRAGASLIHIHQWTRAFSPSVFRTAFASNLPVIVTAHDYFLTCPNGVYYRFDRGEPCRETPRSFGCLRARCDPLSMAHKAIRVLRSLALSATISGTRLDVVHVSDRGRDTLAPLLPKSFRHHRIDNPIALEKRPPATIVSDGRFAYLGRLTREKGGVVAAQAARLADVPILFLGEGPAEADIRATNPQAEMLGWRPRTEIDALLRHQIKAVIAPSLWYETGPLTVHEAAAAGVAAIASNRCGAAERIGASTGIVTAPTVEALAEAMRRLNDTATARQFGLAAYQRYWSDPLDPAAHAKHLIELYEDILSRTDPRC